MTPPLVETKRTPRLADEAAFYNHLRSTNVLGPKISSSEFAGCKILLEHCGAAALSMAHTAYVLATAYHETAGTMQPIDELGGPQYFTRLYDVEGINPERARKMGNTHPGDGMRYHGRGFVQLTWKNNYKRAGDQIGIDLLNDPDLAKMPDVAAQVIVIGMASGWFTGRRLSDFQGYVDMRQVVNGTDKAEHIATIAQVFENALKKGYWQ